MGRINASRSHSHSRSRSPECATTPKKGEGETNDISTVQGFTARHGTAHLVLFWLCLQGTCSRCDDHCQNGGMLDTADCSCKCPLGYFGPSCESFLLGTWTLVNFNEQIAQILVDSSKPLSVCANHWESALRCD